MTLSFLDIFGLAAKRFCIDTERGMFGAVHLLSARRIAHTFAHVKPERWGSDSG